MNSSEIYSLIQEFIEIERRKLWPTENILNSNVEEIYVKLRTISGKDFSCDLEDWIEWFIDNPQFDDGEKKSLKIVYKVLKIETSSISKLKAKDKLKGL